jgi:ankyrin repeat protein
MMWEHGVEDGPTFEKFKKRTATSWTKNTDKIVLRKQRATQSAKDTGCSKTAYGSKSEAERAMKRINSIGAETIKKMERAYRCKKCGAYHLTSTLSFHSTTHPRPQLTLTPNNPIHETLPGMVIIPAGQSNPVISAVMAQDLAELQRLLRDKENPNVYSRSTRTGALHQAAITGNVEICLVLIRAGLPLNAKNKAGSTPFVLAANFGHTHVCKALFDAGADIHIHDHNFNTAWRRATQAHFHETAAYLASIGVTEEAISSHTSLTPTTAAAQYRKAQDRLLDDDFQLIHKHAKDGKTAELRQLLLSGNVNAATRTTMGRTALHLCVFHDRLETAIALVSTDRRLLSINDKERQSPLHKAARMGRLSICEMLLLAGSDVHARNMYKATPLHEAAQGGHQAVYDLLVRFGADPGAWNWERQSPEMLLSEKMASKAST